MKLRRFNSGGGVAFRQFRDRLVGEPKLEPPRALFRNVSLTDLVGNDIEIDERQFSSRLEMGIFLNELMERAEVHKPNVTRDCGHG